VSINTSCQIKSRRKDSRIEQCNFTTSQTGSNASGASHHRQDKQLITCNHHCLCYKLCTVNVADVIVNSKLQCSKETVMLKFEDIIL